MFTHRVAQTSCFQPRCRPRCRPRQSSCSEKASASTSSGPYRWCTEGLQKRRRRVHTSADTFSDEGDNDEDDSLTVPFALVDLADEEDGLLVDSHPVFVCAEQLLHVFFYTTEQCIMGKFETLWLCLKSLTTPYIVHYTVTTPFCSAVRMSSGKYYTLYSDSKYPTMHHEK